MRTFLPEGAEHFIRPAALHTAARVHLGRTARVRGARCVLPEAESTLRVMTYNVHGCDGMDGRVSPRRIARVIELYSPDVIALQELDLGRRRSRVEDQAALIARQLDLQYVFCPTVTQGGEHYGHALLSNRPVEIVKRARLPGGPRRLEPEPRVALWTRLTLAGRPVNLVTTHLGLGWQERVAQVAALLGPDWLGGLPPDEAAVLCGDLNLPPGSPPYRLLARRLRDVQRATPGDRQLPTFSSTRPFVRIDHIFITPQFKVHGVQVPRNDLTRVCSDHFPLIADLEWAQPDGGESQK